MHPNLFYSTIYSLANIISCTYNEMKHIFLSFWIVEHDIIRHQNHTTQHINTTPHHTGMNTTAHTTPAQHMLASVSPTAQFGGNTSVNSGEITKIFPKVVSNVYS